MTEPFDVQGFLPRSSDFVRTLRDEARYWGINAAPVLREFEESNLRKVFSTPGYQNNIKGLRKLSGSDKNYPQRIDRSPLAYGFLTNPEVVVDAVETWLSDRNYYGNDVKSIHHSYYLDSLGESQPYAAHLDTAVMLGAVEDRDLGALTVADADPAMLPLAAYVAHLRLNESQLSELAPIYYRWNTEYVENFSSHIGIHSWVSRVFTHATSHENYNDHFERWVGRVPEGSELAWILIGARHRGNITHEDWFDVVERIIASGASANRFDEVASMPIPFETALAVIENGIDNDLLESMKGE